MGKRTAHQHSQRGSWGSRRRAGAFWRAEGYHQKYRLRHQRELQSALLAHFGSDRALVDSTEAARINGLLGGYGTKAGLSLPSHIEKLLP